MRIFAYIAAVAVLFAIANRSAAAASDPWAGAPASASAAGLRLLTWPGKVAPGAPARPATAPTGVRAALPSSIYETTPSRRSAGPAAPVSAPATVAVASAAATPGAARPRFYSLHRPYGEVPDAITLTPQFLAGGSPDLAQPPPPAPRQVVTASGRVERAVSADPDAAAAN